MADNVKYKEIRGGLKTFAQYCMYIYYFLSQNKSQMQVYQREIIFRTHFEVKKEKILK